MNGKERFGELAPENERRANDCSGICRMDTDEEKNRQTTQALYVVFRRPRIRGVWRGAKGHPGTRLLQGQGLALGGFPKDRHRTDDQQGTPGEQELPRKGKLYERHQVLSLRNRRS